MIKSPLRYPGGKSRAIKTIANLIPPFDEYREPFLGGGSVFIYLKQLYPNKKYWINDLYAELYLFWKAVQANGDCLIEKILEWKNEYSVGKELYRFLNENTEGFNDLERAAAFFIYNRVTFSGTSLSGGFSEAAFKGRFTYSSIERLRNLNGVLDNAAIANKDYEEIVKKSGENVFIFLDPPYYSTAKSSLYGKNGKLHKSFDHIRFADIMRNCSYKWLITYDDCRYIRELFSFANIRSWTQIYGMRNITEASDQNGRELFIANYPIGAINMRREVGETTLFA
ncbi:MAG: DNA adenine methylase [Helicobacteraceae bacterium]|jgi:DNA adenine methylase|nr:DNA adenine methylase [Helicobacteraceae bacterium]